MPSVIVTWKGTCSNREVQTELLSFLNLLAERSAARLSGPTPPRPAFLQLMVEQRQQDVPVLPPVIHYDHDVNGTILVDTDLMPDEESALAEARRHGVPVLPKDTGRAGGYLRLERLHLHGIDFQLFDPRGLYPGEDRMSFVFLRSDDAPFLNGRMALVEEHAKCQFYSSEVIRAADYYVSMPYVHLRYYLEEWSDILFSWVKHYFIPDFHYHRYEPLSNYGSLREIFAETDERTGSGEGKILAFGGILKSFESQVDNWMRDMSQW
jgi:hypothetical protein